jgi:phospholipid-translocating ATPase
MLTGDKMETAKCIAISTGLKAHNERVFEMRDLSNKTEILEAIDKYKINIRSQMLMVDGNTLAVIVADKNIKYRFFDVAKEAKSVCICRCSPT